MKEKPEPVMGEHERRAEPPNGLLPDEAASVMRVLDLERWSKAEERTAELIGFIQPTAPSEERRNAVADYVQRLIMKCFPCQVKVVTFGSVPLKTYLPDGDIDLTTFSGNQNLKETWAHQVRDMLKKEEENENAEFRVKEVQYIQAEVKIIKCLVENIVVDISFDQLGGLCTLCFLLEVDHLISQNHLFKRSVILIKAWCYYESRILGAHHGLISTYALETLVLYIFHVFNNSFVGPLEVLYRFLEFFSKFDWGNFCVSLWGPVPISSLPDVTAEPPRKGGGELLLSKLFLDACSSVYAVFPGGQENQGQPFVSKHFNVIDPLRTNNNLGRSVSKGNFFRIRSAFAYGAKRLARLLDCPKEDLYFEVNQFFLNTWDRHGSGCRPDAPVNDLCRLRLSNPDHLCRPETLRNNAGSTKKEIYLARTTHVDVTCVPCDFSSQQGNYTLDCTYGAGDLSLASHTQSQKNHGNSINSMNHIKQGVSSNHATHIDEEHTSSKPESLVNDSLGKFLFARTRSSPELTDAYGEAYSHGRGGVPESTKSEISSARLDNSTSKNVESDVSASRGGRPATEHPSSFQHLASHQGHDVGGDTNSLSSYHDDSRLGVTGEEFRSAFGAHGMQQEEQDLVNMMASSTGHFTGQVHMPLNLNPNNLPLPILPSVLASMGYGNRNLAGIYPPLLESPWGAHVQFHQGLISSQLTHYFSSIALNANPENSIESDIKNIGHGEVNHGYWHEQGRGEHFDLDNGIYKALRIDDDKQSTSAGYNSVHSSRPGSSGSHARLKQKFPGDDNHVSTEEDNLEVSQGHGIGGNEAHLDDRTVSSRSVLAGRPGSIKSKTSSESSWEGSSASSAKASKSSREKRSKKTAWSELQSSVHSKDKSVSEHCSTQADDDIREWHLSTMGSEMSEGGMGLGSVTSVPCLDVASNKIPGFEPVLSSGSDSLIPITPMLLGPGSQQRAIDNSGVAPFTFYPTGPPVPFYTMLPFYNSSTETGAPNASINHMNVEEQLENGDSGQVLDRLDTLSASVEPSEYTPDILHSNFASHWQNLQYGRFCQNSQNPAPMLYPSPLVVPPAYLQDHSPWDGPERSLTSTMNLFTHLMNCGPHLVPVAPAQSITNRPVSVYQSYLDEMPRLRSGTGTYLPNPKVSAHDRHLSSSRRGKYSYDRSEREGNWNSNSRSRGNGRSHNRNHGEKQSSRPDRLAGNGSRTDKPWSSYRHHSYSSYLSQNGPTHSNSMQSSSANMSYSMYPSPAMNSGVSSNGPSLVMLYPYDHNIGYGSPAEQLEFGSLGPMGFAGLSGAPQLNESTRSSGVYEEQRFHSGTAQMSSPDQPSSPHLQRGI